MGGGAENINRSNSIFKNIWKYLWKIMGCRTLIFHLFFHRSFINASRFLIPHWLFFYYHYIYSCILYKTFTKYFIKSLQWFFILEQLDLLSDDSMKCNPNRGMISSIIEYEVMLLFHKESCSVLRETMIQLSIILRLIHSCCKIIFSFQKHCGK
jgi:hypothetical protein